MSDLVIDGVPVKVMADGQEMTWPKGYSVNMFGTGSPGSVETLCKVFYWYQPVDPEYDSGTSFEYVGEVEGADPIEATARGLLMAWDHLYQRKGPESTATISDSWHVLLPGPLAIASGDDV